jgi:hypothetical protein
MFSKRWWVLEYLSASKNMTCVYFSASLYIYWLLQSYLPSVFSDPIMGGFLGLPIMVPLGPALRMAPPPEDFLIKRRLSFILSFLSRRCFFVCLSIELLTFSNPTYDKWGRRTNRSSVCLECSSWESCSCAERVFSPGTNACWCSRLLKPFP